MEKVYQAEYAEGEVYDFQDESAIKPEVLETFAYSGPKQKVCYRLNEFSAVCPFSGLPDYGIVEMTYIPDALLVELKSLKYYYLSFRQVGLFQEAITARIFNDLFPLLKPHALQIKTIYNTRGGIDTTCEVNSDFQ